MRVSQSPDGTWRVIDDDEQPIAVGFKTNAEAWKWFDRQDYQSIKDENTRRRVFVAVQNKWF